MRLRGLLFSCSLVFLASLNALSNNYYFSSTGGDDSRTSAQAQHPDKPWMSINKLNDFFPNLRPGDSILFQRGCTFIGSIRITSSGDPSRPIVFGAYGTGNPPVITGFTTLTN